MVPLVAFSVPGERAFVGEDQLTLQIDGTDGSAVAGLWDCWTQSAEETPTLGTFDLGRNERLSATRDYRGDWEIVPAVGAYKNPYRYGWESFMVHVAGDSPAVAPLGAGIRDVQLSEACLKSASEGQWIDMASSLKFHARNSYCE